MSFVTLRTGVAVALSSLIISLACPAVSAAPSLNQDIHVQKESEYPAWWKEAVFYQIYPCLCACRLQSMFIGKSEMRV
ncbi:TPA: hypothetical protein RFU55_004801 [Klebsiella aerogenes]|nr:hypothetical protein [Klebsiella aerogenes]